MKQSAKRSEEVRVLYDPGDADRERLMNPYLRIGFVWVDSCRVKGDDGNFLYYWILRSNMNRHPEKKNHARKKRRNGEDENLDSVSAKEPKPGILRRCRLCPQKCKQRVVPHLTAFKCFAGGVYFDQAT
jgi:hypothetical protein